MREEMEGDFKLAFNLAPPMLAGRDPNGRPKKREFGAWILPLLRRLAQLKGLRGTVFDPFGYLAERKARADADLATTRGSPGACLLG